jgi:hypothetical protein
MIALPTSTSIWIAAGVTDMRRDFTGLSAAAQTVLEQNPYSGHVFVFRGRRGEQARFRIPIGICGCRVPLASALWKTIAVISAHTGPRRRRCCSR